jgi:hypothetical protein
MTTKSTYRSLSAHRLSERTVLWSFVKPMSFADSVRLQARNDHVKYIVFLRFIHTSHIQMYHAFHPPPTPTHK